MTKKIYPHKDTKYWTADEIAECCGVNDETYKELWNKIVPLYDGKPKSEYPNENVGTYSLSKYWSKLSDAAKLDVNEALKKKAAEWKAL
jgi:hypothetical protein